jgi:MFS family permease
MALVFLCYGGCYAGVVGYLPLYLRNSGWTALSADGALAALTAASVVGVVPLSTLSDRLGSRKKVLYFASTVFIINIGLLAIFNTSIIWLLVTDSLVLKDSWHLLLPCTGNKVSEETIRTHWGYMTFSSLGNISTIAGKQIGRD